MTDTIQAFLLAAFDQAWEDPKVVDQHFPVLVEFDLLVNPPIPCLQPTLEEMAELF
jgi:hypothetical protein